MKYVPNYFDKLDLKYMLSFIQGSIDNEYDVNNEAFNDVLYVSNSIKDKLNINLDGLYTLSRYISQKVSIDNKNVVELKEDDKIVFFEELTEFLLRVQSLSLVEVSEKDRCLGKTFKLSISDICLNTYLIICIKKEESGWFLYIDDSKSTEKGFKCNKSCEPKLYEILDIYGINYPNDLKGYFEWLWNASTVYNLGVEQVKEEFYELSKWINACNDLSPKTRLREYR